MKKLLNTLYVLTPDSYGNTAQLRLCASPDLFRQFCGLKSLKYIQYSCTFQTLT